MSSELEPIQQALEQIRREMARVIIGQTDAVDRALAAIFAGGNVLLEGIPGVAKTVLVRSLAYLLGCEFQRIQFTPDLTRSDIVGQQVFRPETNDYALLKGPIFTTFLMVDEINRAPAKAQSVLLQAMQEHRVTLDRTTFPLTQNFTVFATQNPIESEGVFPLPEAQLDRFLLRITMECPDAEDEFRLAERTLTREAPERLLDQGVIQPVLTSERLHEMRCALEKITVHPALTRYVVEIVRTTRDHVNIKVGAGPRATQALMLAGRAHAGFQGRSTILPEDIQAVALSCLEHRIILSPEFIEKGLTCAEVIRHILSSVPPPRHLPGAG